MSDYESIKEGLVGSLGNRATAVKQYHKFETKCKMEMKSIKKNNKTILAWPRNWVHVVNFRRLRRSVLRHPRNMITLVAIALSVIMIPPSLLTVSDTK